MGASASSVDSTGAGLSFPVNAVAPNKQASETEKFSDAVARRLAPAKTSPFASLFGRRPTEGKQEKLVDAGGLSHAGDTQLLRGNSTTSGFVQAIHTAFDQHYPLALKPDHFWLMIMQGIAEHVNKNSEALRDRFVSHEGKKTLEVERDGFSLGAANDWAGVISEFEDLIKANTTPGVVDQMAPGFTTTTAIEKVACQVVAMSCMQSYFEYECTTRCGFPRITLLGSRDDWIRLCTSACPVVKHFCLPEFAKEWNAALTSVFDQIRQTVTTGKANASFWQSMCKLGGSEGSGGYAWFNGWFNVFLPFNSTGRENEFAFESYADSNLYAKEDPTKRNVYDSFRNSGPFPRSLKTSHVPSGMCTAPVNWNYLGSKIPLTFHAGFIGASQDPTTLTVTPEVGWFISMASPTPAAPPSVEEAQSEDRSMLARVLREEEAQEAQ